MDVATGKNPILTNRAAGVIFPELFRQGSGGYLLPRDIRRDRMRVQTSTISEESSEEKVNLVMPGVTIGCSNRERSKNSIHDYAEGSISRKPDAPCASYAFATS
jgi:hypothetical protein